MFNFKKKKIKEVPLLDIAIAESGPLNIRALLARYLIEKNNLISSFIGENSNYVTRNQIEGILNQSIYQIFMVAETMIYIEKTAAGIFSDTDICPWCIASKQMCRTCRYADVHKRCHFESSTYQQIISKIAKKMKKEKVTISMIPGMTELTERYIKQFKYVVNLLK